MLMSSMFDLKLTLGLVHASLVLAGHETFFWDEYCFLVYGDCCSSLAIITDWQKRW